MRNLSSVFVILAFVVINVLIRGGKAGKQKKETREPVELRQRQKAAETKREAAARPEQWRAAKAQQDDARQVHSINMDSCENRLESLRVLYDAGILDREEYAQRVARVKAKHAHGAR